MRWSLLLAWAGCQTGPEPEADPQDEPEIELGECGTQIGYTPRVVRLTHSQYDNSIRDLLGLDIRPSEAFIADPTFGGFDNNAASLETTDRLARDYRRAAEQVAEQLVETPGAILALSPCDPSLDAEGCAQQFVRSLGERIHRRPLTDEEVERYLTVHAAGAGLYESGTPFEQGMAMVIEGMLQSPDFLYRLELTPATPGSDAILLSGYEIATRLSYMLWNAPPDEALLAAAAAGSLATAEGVLAQAERMVSDPKAASMVDDFHRQLLGVGRYEDLTRDPDLFPEFDASLGPLMIEEALAFTRHVALDSGGTYADLLTEPAGFVNRDLAPLYDLDPSDFGSELVYTPLDPSRRSGLLTLSGFLASNAYFDISNPIRRGVFVQRTLMCTELPDPPGDADLQLPPIDGGTTREIVEQHTSPAECQVCHGIINPAGFAFEHYDAIGRWRDQENGHPVDASGEVPTASGEPIRFVDGVDLAHQLADDATARRCYLTHWFRYAYARTESEADRCTIERLDERARSTDYLIRDLIVGLGSADTFRLRPANEGSP